MSSLRYVTLRYVTWTHFFNLTTHFARLPMLCEQTTACYNEIPDTNVHKGYTMNGIIWGGHMCLGLCLVHFLLMYLCVCVCWWHFHYGWYQSRMWSQYGRRHHCVVVTWILVGFFLSLGWNCRLGMIFFVLVSFYISVRLTASGYDFPYLGWNFRISVLVRNILYQFFYYFL